MNPYLKALPYLLSGVLLNAFAQIAMKKAVTAAGMSWSLGPLVRLFLHPWMLVCMGCYAVSIVVWAAAMKLVPVNFAYPFLALGFVAGAFMTRLFLHPWMLVCMGCYAVSIVVWAAAMKLVPVNFAYPFLALGFVAGAFMSRLFLGEGIPPLRWLALAIIVLGVGLQAFTAPSQREHPNAQEPGK